MIVNRVRQGDANLPGLGTAGNSIHFSTGTLDSSNGPIPRPVQPDRQAPEQNQQEPRNSPAERVHTNGDTIVEHHAARADGVMNSPRARLRANVPGAAAFAKRSTTNCPGNRSRFRYGRWRGYPEHRPLDPQSSRA